jgi:hypothetical protein
MRKKLRLEVLNLKVLGDVPDTAEVSELRARLLSDYPLSIANKFWTDLLRGSRNSGLGIAA